MIIIHKWKYRAFIDIKHIIYTYFYLKSIENGDFDAKYVWTAESINFRLSILNTFSHWWAY